MAEVDSSIDGTSKERTAPSRAGAHQRPLNISLEQADGSEMTQHTYLYAFTWARCTSLEIGPGIDTRFEVEFVRQGQLAAVASRVGLDRFDAERFEAKTAGDARWLERVAMRHDQVVREVVRHMPVMPLRLGTLFHNRSALLWRMSRCEAKVAAFLHDRGDRQEWAVKVFMDTSKATPNASCQVPPPPQVCCMQREIHEIKTILASHADHCRVHFLPNNSNGRRGKIVYDAAYLLSRSALDCWSAAVQHLQKTKRFKGLLLKVAGPSPPYHFCSMRNESALRQQDTVDSE